MTHVADLGGLTERYRYDVFGAPTIKGAFGAVRSASLIGNRFLFTGREYDEDFGIYEYRARAYSPYSGRFMTEDPKGFAAGDYNLFRYCKNDPEDLIDPMGLATTVAQSTLPWDQIHTREMMTGSNLPQNANQQFPGGLPYFHMALVSAGQPTQLRGRYKTMNEAEFGNLDRRFESSARRFVDVANAMMNSKGMEVRVASGFRTFAEQADLYSKYLAGTGDRAAEPGHSAHNYGMAIDIAVIRGSASVDSRKIWARLGGLGMANGLRWGHSFDDDDHFQHAGLPLSGRELFRRQQAGLDVLTGQ